MTTRNRGTALIYLALLMLSSAGIAQIEGELAHPAEQQLLELAWRRVTDIEESEADLRALFDLDGGYVGTLTIEETREGDPDAVGGGVTIVRGVFEALGDSTPAVGMLVLDRTPQSFVPLAVGDLEMVYDLTNAVQLGTTGVGRLTSPSQRGWREFKQNPLPPGGTCTEACDEAFEVNSIGCNSNLTGCFLTETAAFVACELACLILPDPGPCEIGWGITYANNLKECFEENGDCHKAAKEVLDSCYLTCP